MLYSVTASHHKTPLILWIRFLYASCSSLRGPLPSKGPRLWKRPLSRAESRVIARRRDSGGPGQTSQPEFIPNSTSSPLGTALPEKGLSSTTIGDPGRRQPASRAGRLLGWISGFEVDHLISEDWRLNRYGNDVSSNLTRPDECLNGVSYETSNNTQSCSDEESYSDIVNFNDQIAFRWNVKLAAGGNPRRLFFWASS